MQRLRAMTSVLCAVMLMAWGAGVWTGMIDPILPQPRLEAALPVPAENARVILAEQRRAEAELEAATAAENERIDRQDIAIYMLDRLVEKHGEIKKDSDVRDLAAKLSVQSVHFADALMRELKKPPQEPVPAQALLIPPEPDEKPFRPLDIGPGLAAIADIREDQCGPLIR